MTVSREVRIQIIGRYVLGDEPKDIALDCGVNAKFVINMCRRYGLPSTKARGRAKGSQTAEEIRRAARRERERAITDAFARGDSYDEICRKHHCSYQYVAKCARRAGLPLRKKPRRTSSE